MFRRRRQRLAIDDADQLVDTSIQATGIITRLEARHDRLVDDAIGDRIGDHTFKTIADFDADPAVIACNEHEDRSEEHTSELQSLMRISYAVFCLKKKKKTMT